MYSAHKLLFFQVIAHEHVMYNNIIDLIFKRSMHRLFFCNEQDETPEHVIGGCSIGMQFSVKLGMNEMTGTSVDNIHRLNPPAGVPKEEFPALIALACWQLWKTRNAAIFRNEQPVRLLLKPAEAVLL